MKRANRSFAIALGAALGTVAAAAGAEGLGLDALRGVPPLSPERAEALAELVASALRARLAPGAEGQPESACASGSEVDSEPRALLVSASDGRRAAFVGVGVARGFAAACVAALAELAGRWPPDAVPVGVKIDFVETVETVEGAARPFSALVGELADGLLGLAIAGEPPLILLPEEIVSRALVGRAGRLDRERLASYVAERRSEPAARALRASFESPEPLLSTFTTRGFFSFGNELVPLFRGHRPYLEVTPGDLANAIGAAGDYLLRELGADGRFTYVYRAARDEAGGGYNILRHAGTAYALLELFEAERRGTLLDGARRALDYLAAQTRACEIEGAAVRCVVERGEVKLGGNALAILALAKHAEVTGDRGRLPLARELGRFLLAAQAPDGRFRFHKLRWPEGTIDRGMVSQYYPGEAVLALLRLHALDADPVWLDAAERGARFLIEVRDGHLAQWQLPHDHWLLYALTELERRRPDPRRAGHALEVAGAIVSRQHRATWPPDHQGGFERPPRSNPTATRAEGLCAAWSLARESGRAEAAVTILEALRAAAAFQLRTRIGPEVALYLPAPERALGGFRSDLTDFDVRIDTVQHNLSSLLCLSRALAAGPVQGTTAER